MYDQPNGKHGSIGLLITKFDSISGVCDQLHIIKTGNAQPMKTCHCASLLAYIIMRGRSYCKSSPNGCNLAKI